MPRHDHNHNYQTYFTSNADTYLSRKEAREELRSTLVKLADRYDSIATRYETARIRKRKAPSNVTVYDDYCARLDKIRLAKIAEAHCLRIIDRIHALDQHEVMPEPRSHILYVEGRNFARDLAIAYPHRDPTPILHFQYRFGHGEYLRLSPHTLDHFGIDICPFCEQTLEPADPEPYQCQTLTPRFYKRKDELCCARCSDRYVPLYEGGHADLARARSYHIVYTKWEDTHGFTSPMPTLIEHPYILSSKTIEEWGYGVYTPWLAQSPQFVTEAAYQQALQCHAPVKVRKTSKRHTLSH